MKNLGSDLYNSLRHTNNRKYFSGLSLRRNRREARIRGEKFGDFLAEKKVILS